MATQRVSPVSFLKLAADVSSFYGFRPAREIEKRAQQLAKDAPPRPTQRTHTFVTTAAACASCSTARPQEPVLAFYATPAPSHLPHGYTTRETGEFGLQIVGTPESVGEIILFKTIAAILKEWGSPVKCIRVNALGDRDSRERFMRELALFVRKNMQRLPAELHTGLQQDPSLLYHTEHEEAQLLANEAPRSINFLSEKSRVHFRNILEHLEQLGLPYELDDSLVGDDRAHHVAFGIDLAEPDATVVAAIGGRYDDFLRQYGRRAGSTGVGASIFFRKKGAANGTFSVERAAPKPKIYFAQLGLKAKLQGLTVLEMLRAAKIPVEQSFDAAHLSTQLQAAQAQKVPYLLIMGQREALDGTVIVRSMQNSAQTIMELAAVPRFLKTLR